MPKRASAAVPAASEVQPLTAIIPEDVRALIEPRPLIPGEDPRQYDLLLARLASDVKPKDFLDWIYVNDILELVWEDRRLRRFKAALVWANVRTAGGRLLAPVLAPEEVDTYSTPMNSENLVSGYQGGYKQSVRTVEKALESLGLDRDSLIAASFAYSLDSVEKMDRMLKSNASRRDAVLREIERRRFATGQRLRNVSDAVVLEFDTSGGGE